jgi:hypothetical protein
MNRHVLSPLSTLIHLPLCCIALAACVEPRETMSDGLEGTGSTAGAGVGSDEGDDGDDGPAPAPGDADTSSGSSGSDGGDDTSTGAPEPIPPFDTGGDDDDTTGTTGEPECPDAMVCTPLAPLGWDGPFELTDGETACTGAYENAAFEGGNAPTADAASCQCGCEVSSASCNPEGNLQYWDGECVGAADEAYVLDPSSTIGEPLPAGMRVNAYTGGGGQDEAACQTEILNANFPAPSFQTPAVACEFWGTHIDCDAGRCLPPLDGGEMCIAREGDFECPADGPFQNRRLYYAEISDQRTCGCDCETTIDCDQDFAVLNILGFNGATYSVPHFESVACTEVAQVGTLLSATFVPSAPVASCEADSTISGGLTATQPWTACCM